MKDIFTGKKVCIVLINEEDIYMTVCKGSDIGVYGNGEDGSLGFVPYTAMISMYLEEE
jgi:hypothetical protein